MSGRAKWTEADFDAMSWHDCQINSIGLDQDGEWQSDLVLELDYIVEWLCGEDKRCRFRVAPALLKFTNVDNLRFDISLKFKQPLAIYHVERTELPVTGHMNYHWILKLQNYSDLKDSMIEFDATGFVQELTGKAIETESLSLTNAERAESRKGELKPDLYGI